MSTLSTHRTPMATRTWRFINNCRYEGELVPFWARRLEMEADATASEYELVAMCRMIALGI